MKVLEFDIKKGIFHFEINDLNVDKHSHPAVEIMKAIKGSFSLETDFGPQNNLTFTIIDANIKHTITTGQNKIELLMIECNNKKLKEYLINRGIDFYDGVFTSTEITNRDELISDIHSFSTEQNLKLANDKRVQECIEIIETEDLQCYGLITYLSSKIFLSESRLSHLFKSNIGISIKKYCVWNRLKFAINFLLNNETNLKETSIEVGFFDQAHLSNAFKNFLGISPFKVINSRTLQF